jgi:gamma-glutamyl:cysteine ligase YbdK (ATP-grasp superfamily)
MTGGEPIRRSVEIEYWVIDEDGHLTDPGSLVEAAPGVEREFTRSLLEVKTSPCETTDELRDELFERLDAVLRAANDGDKRLVPLATPLGRGPKEDLPSERTRIQSRVVGDRVAYVRHFAGTHVYV